MFDTIREIKDIRFNEKTIHVYRTLHLKSDQKDVVLQYVKLFDFRILFRFKRDQKVTFQYFTFSSL